MGVDCPSSWLYHERRQQGDLGGEFAIGTASSRALIEGLSVAQKKPRLCLVADWVAWHCCGCLNVLLLTQASAIRITVWAFMTSMPK